MRLLVTRPLLDAMPLAESLAAKGHDVLISPLIVIEPTEAELPAESAIGGLAFTSANGVRAFMAKCTSSTELGAWQTHIAYAVGPQTAYMLRHYGWPKVQQAGGDVGQLAALIAAHYQPHTDRPILHISGRDRAGDLAVTLEAAEIGVHRATLYRAEPAGGFAPPAEAALTDRDEPVDGVLLYSARSAKIFIDFHAQLATAHKPTAFCLSTALAEQLAAAGFETVTAAQPTKQAMLALF